MILICAAAIMAMMIAVVIAVVIAAIGGIYHACKVNRGYTAIG